MTTRWAPLPGAQFQFLTCPIYEALMHGTRGGGKTDTLLMSFAQHTGKGFGQHWRGVLFRLTYPQLADVVAKSQSPASGPLLTTLKVTVPVSLPPRPSETT